MTYDKWSKMLIVRYPDRIILPALQTAGGTVVHTIAASLPLLRLMTTFVITTGSSVKRSSGEW